jgi:hypothetical protein
MAKRTTKVSIPKEAQEVQDELKSKIEEYEDRQAKEKKALESIDKYVFKAAEGLADKLTILRQMSNPPASKLAALHKAVSDLKRIFG